MEQAESAGDVLGLEVVWYAFQGAPGFQEFLECSCIGAICRCGVRCVAGIAEVIADEPSIPDAFHAVLRSVVKATGKQNVRSMGKKDRT